MNEWPASLEVSDEMCLFLMVLCILVIVVISVHVRRVAKQMRKNEVRAITVCEGTNHKLVVFSKKNKLYTDKSCVEMLCFGSLYIDQIEHLIELGYRADSFSHHSMENNNATSPAEFSAMQKQYDELET